MEYHDAVADALVSGAKSYIDTALEPLFARLAVLEARAPVDPADIAAALRADVEGGLRQFVSELVTALPPARDGVDGKDADPAVTQRLVIAEVSRQVEALPPARDGADGKDGAPGEKGEKGDPGEVGEMGSAGEKGDPGEPGEDGEDGRDGIGLTGAIIDRSGRLVLTLSDGSLRELGEIVGRDGKDADMEMLADIIVREVAKMPKARDGLDGLGFDDLEVVHDGERTVTFRLSRGDMVKDFPLVIPAIIDRGVWREGRYAKGDGVTWEGSFFIAQKDTEGRPLISKDWRQAVKAGRPGRVETVKTGPASAVKGDGGA